MKKNKIILLMLIGVTLFMPTVANALTEEEAYNNIKKLPFEEIDNKLYFKTKIIDPDIIMGDECLFTQKDYENRLDTEDGLSSDEWIKESTNSCKMYFYQDMLKLYLKYLGHDIKDFSLIFDYENVNKNKATLNYSYEDNDGNSSSLDLDLEISYLSDVDMKEVEKAKQILSNFEQKDRLYDLQLINLTYHYGILEEADYMKDAIFARYSNFKKIMEQYPEYQYVSSGGRGGGNAITRGRVIQAGMFKDEIMYGIKQLDHCEELILFVDKDASGTLKEKVEAKLNEYFNNKVNISVEIGENADDMNSPEWFDNYINDFFQTEGLDTTGYYSKILINDTELRFVVVEIPNQYLEDLYVEAYDNETGVNIKTDSYDVPLDVRVKAKDVKEDKKIKDRFTKENLIIQSAYDMSLTKSFDGTIVNTIDKGIEVYFPVDENYKVGDKHKIYYVTDETSKKEVYDGVVVKVNDKNYVKFITNHFSTYVLATNGIENPKTFDDINNNILISVLSVICLCGTIYYLKKQTN